MTTPFFLCVGARPYMLVQGASHSRRKQDVQNVLVPTDGSELSAKTVQARGADRKGHEGKVTAARVS
jgi:hypothetical protein